MMGSRILESLSQRATCGARLYGGTVCLLLRGFSEVLLIQSNDDLLFREATEIMKAAASHNHAVYTQRQRQHSASHARS